MIWLLLYLALGVGVVMLTRWMDAWDYRDFMSSGPHPFLVGLCLFCWPIALVVAVAIVALRAAEQAKERRTTIREEAAREARKAAQEVEDFMRRGW